jgi:hypothetical protein
MTLWIFPGYGSLQESAMKWTVKIKGFSFQVTSNSTKTKMINYIGRKILSPMRNTDNEAKELFTERTAGFTAIPMITKLKIVAVIVQEQEHGKLEQDDETIFKSFQAQLKSDSFPQIELESNKDGIFEGQLHLSDSWIQSFQAKSPSVKLIAYVDDDNSVYCVQDFTLIYPTGISIISDVDDTIKDSEVYNGIISAARKALFAQPREVPGMADSYNLLYAKNIPIHYVSGAPYQLYSGVDIFLKRFYFPPGSLSLRETSEWKTTEYKQHVILDIINDFPSRQFILIGDRFFRI